MSEHEITITHYGNRFFAIYVRGDLLAVTVYRKGAEAIRSILLTAQTLQEGTP